MVIIYIKLYCNRF